MTHFYTDYVTQNPDINRCRALARLSWTWLNWKDVPVHDDQLPRLWKEEGKSLPYVKDLFDIGTRNAGDSEICVFTNDDIQVRSDAFLVIAAKMQSTDACYCFRRDFPPKLQAPVPDRDYVRGHPYSGSDLIAFRTAWWRKHRHQMPDMLIGVEAWDAVFRCLINITNPGANQLMDLIAHEKAGNSWWETPGNRYRLGCQRHNLRLAWDWFKAHGFSPLTFGIRNRL